MLPWLIPPRTQPERRQLTGPLEPRSKRGTALEADTGLQTTLQPNRNMGDESNRRVGTEATQKQCRQQFKHPRRTPTAEEENHRQKKKENDWRPKYEHMDKLERKFLLVRECCRDTTPEAFKSKKSKTELRKGSVPMRTRAWWSDARTDRRETQGWQDLGRTGSTPPNRTRKCKT
jgi:hypothetical protein